MTQFEFQLLTEQEQVGQLYEEGVYIGKRKINNRAVLLYQLDSFYVEVYYLSYRRKVQKIRCSGSTSLLDPYLEQIDVELLAG